MIMFMVTCLLSYWSFCGWEQTCIHIHLHMYNSKCTHPSPSPSKPLNIGASSMMIMLMVTCLVSYWSFCGWEQTCKHIHLHMYNSKGIHPSPSPSNLQNPGASSMMIMFMVTCLVSYWSFCGWEQTCKHIHLHMYNSKCTHPSPSPSKLLTAWWWQSNGIWEWCSWWHA